MIIQCPRCSTRWRVPSRPPVENPSFKCGRCHHLFRQFPGAPAAGESKPSAERSRGAAPAADNMEFIFPKPAPVLPEERPDERAPQTTDHAPSPEPPSAPLRTRPPRRPAETPPVVRRESGTEDSLSEASPAPAIEGIAPPIERTATETEVTKPTAAEEDTATPAILGTSEANEGEKAAPPEGEAAAAKDEEADQHVAADRDQDVAFAQPHSSHTGVPVVPHEPEVFGDDEDWEIALEPEPDDGHVLRPEPPVSPPSALRVLGKSVATVLGILAVLALAMRGAPEAAKEWLEHVPLIGPSLARDRVLASNVLLQNVSGGYQRLRNGRRVFVIAGDAFNNSSAAIERIEVEGVLYGVTGEVDQKVVNAGNRTMVSDLSEAEIVFLQGLDPRTTLAPGQSTPFLIVFLEPPRDLREFSSRVLSARPTRRAATLALPERAQRPTSVG